MCGLIGAQGQIDFLPSSLPRKVGIKKALCKYTLTHSLTVTAIGDGLLTCKSGREENECGINVNGRLIWEIKVKSRSLMKKIRFIISCLLMS